MSFLSGFGEALAVAFIAVRSRRLLAPSARRKSVKRLQRKPAADGALDVDAVDASAFRAALAQVSASGLVALKRSFDVFLSLAVLLAFSPLLFLAALAIKMETPGPAIYRQTRVGRGGKLFKVFKLRSMTADAEKDGPQYASVNDARITRVGRILRRFRLDEIPQAINVLRGEMSFVGPRPERPEFVKELEREIPNYHCRHMVKPGITGWAQVKYEYAASVEGARHKLRYDLYYIQNFSLFLDLLILLMTVRVALFGLGSR